MKKNIFYRFSLTIFLLISLMTLLINCNSSKHSNASTSNKDYEWFRNKVWLNGLQLAPHESINQQEFSKQYHTNKTWWDEAFNFLKTHDLADMKPGKYVIDSNNVIATITQLNPGEKDQVNWESHRNFNDLQYIIKGKVQMGVAALSSPTSIVKLPYDPKTDNENFTVTGGKYYDAEPGTFFIFSPNEIHRPAFKVEGYNDIKKIVIKVRVPK